MNSNRPRSEQNRFKPLGFTIVEILVVLAVIGLLVSLIVPAVMAARGAANRLDCENRLRQFGVALHNFESTHKHLPVGTIFTGGGPAGTDWLPTQLQLLPHLEQTAMYEKLVSKMRHSSADVVIPIFHCPTEDVSVGISYRACTARHVGCTELPNRQFTGTLSRGYGALSGRTSLNPLTLAEITDGLSNTAAMSERTISYGPGRRFEKDRDIWFSGAIDVGFSIQAASEDETVAVCKALNYTPTSSYSPFSGRNIFAVGSVSTFYNHSIPPNSSITDCSLSSAKHAPDDSWDDDDCGMVVGARSRHYDRTVNVLLMDGSVRIVPPHVDLEAWRALASRADGDISL